MTPQDIKAAYMAQKNVIYHQEKLQKLKDTDPVPHYYRNYWSINFQEHLREKHQREIHYQEDRIKEHQDIVDRVLAWAETAPKEIRQITRMRILDQEEWAEISLSICHSGVPNTAYMKLKRYMENEDPEQTAKGMS